MIVYISTRINGVKKFQAVWIKQNNKKENNKWIIINGLKITGFSYLIIIIKGILIPALMNFVFLSSKLKKSVSIGKRNLEEKIIIDEIIELYVPIYEARLIGPKKSIRLMRIDAIRKKVL